MIAATGAARKARILLMESPPLPDRHQTLQSRLFGWGCHPLGQRQGPSVGCMLLPNNATTDVGGRATMTSGLHRRLRPERTPDMDANRFDALTRGLTGAAPSRRRLLTGVGGGGLGALATMFGLGETGATHSDCRHVGAHCNRNGQGCSSR